VLGGEEDSGRSLSRDQNEMPVQGWRWCFCFTHRLVLFHTPQVASILSDQTGIERLKHDYEPTERR
jgi:hypothetical protein